MDVSASSYENIPHKKLDNILSTHLQVQNHLMNLVIRNFRISDWVMWINTRKKILVYRTKP